MTGVVSEEVLTSKVCAPAPALVAFVTLTWSASPATVAVELPIRSTTVVPSFEAMLAPRLRLPPVTSRTEKLAPVKVPAGPVSVISPGNTS